MYVNRLNFTNVFDKKIIKKKKDKVSEAYKTISLRIY